jgi:hypothetical protein
MQTATLISNTLPPFGQRVELTSALQEAVTNTVEDIHAQIITDFMPVFSPAQRESVNVCFEQLSKKLRRTVVVDARALLSEIETALSAVTI